MNHRRNPAIRYVLFASGRVFFKIKKQSILKFQFQDSPGILGVKTLPSGAGGAGSIPTEELRSHMPQGRKTRT